MKFREYLKLTEARVDMTMRDLRNNPGLTAKFYHSSYPPIQRGVSQLIQGFGKAQGDAIFAGAPQDYAPQFFEPEADGKDPIIYTFTASQEFDPDVHDEATVVDVLREEIIKSRDYKRYLSKQKIDPKIYLEDKPDYDGNTGFITLIRYYPDKSLNEPQPEGGYHSVRKAAERQAAVAKANQNQQGPVTPNASI